MSGATGKKGTIQRLLRVTRSTLLELEELAAELDAGEDSAGAVAVAVSTGEDPDQLLSADAVGRLLGMRTKSLANWRVQGKGPRFVELGSGVRYRRADVTEWIAANVRRSTSDQGEGARKGKVGR